MEPSAPAHTEGPWQAYSDDHDPYVIIGDLDGPDDGVFHFTEVCTINESAPDAEANRRLIIAAPELLDALRGALLSLEWRIDMHDSGFCPDAEAAAALRKFRDEKVLPALAKAGAAP